jgi:hypothetical protein
MYLKRTAIIIGINVKHMYSYRVTSHYKIILELSLIYSMTKWANKACGGVHSVLIIGHTSPSI